MDVHPIADPPTGATIVLHVAARALRSGVDPQIVREFLERVLAAEDERRIAHEVRTASEEFFAELDRAEARRVRP